MDLLVWLPCAPMEMTEQLKNTDPIHRHCSIKSFTRQTFVLFATLLLDFGYWKNRHPVRKVRLVSFGQRTHSHFQPSLQIESF